MRIYTKSGDDGSTGTLGQGRAQKSDGLFTALGDLDELSAYLGLVCASHPKSAERLAEIQGFLLQIGAEVASCSKDERFLAYSIDAEISRLEDEVDHAEMELAPLTNFILPGGTAGSSYLHVARTICRRAERSLVSLRHQQPSIRQEVVKYMNRLSDWLFVMARAANAGAGVEDKVWVMKND